MDHQAYVDLVFEFRFYKGLADKACSQIDQEGFYYLPESESNSIAVIMQHMIGNMKSRWTDFLTTDGEKTWRNRDQEFEQTKIEIPILLTAWEEAWQLIFKSIEEAESADQSTQIYIRGKAHNLHQAIIRQLAHYAYHVGQIVYLAKMYKSMDWHCLSIPKQQSRAYNSGEMPPVR